MQKTILIALTFVLVINMTAIEASPRRRNIKKMKKLASRKANTRGTPKYRGRLKKQNQSFQNMLSKVVYIYKDS